MNCSELGNIIIESWWIRLHYARWNQQRGCWEAPQRARQPWQAPCSFPPQLWTRWNKPPGSWLPPQASSSRPLAPAKEAGKLEHKKTECANAAQKKRSRTHNTDAIGFSGCVDTNEDDICFISVQLNVGWEVKIFTSTGLDNLQESRLVNGINRALRWHPSIID